MNSRKNRDLSLKPILITDDTKKSLKIQGVARAPPCTRYRSSRTHESLYLAISYPSHLKPNTNSYLSQLVHTSSHTEGLG